MSSNTIELIKFNQLLQILPAEQRMVVIFDNKPVSPEDAHNFEDKYVIDIRALQYPEGDIGLGITLTDTVIMMPDLRGLFGKE